jgi:hypothetical protein
VPSPSRVFEITFAMERTEAMEAAKAKKDPMNEYRRCASFRECNLEECIFYDGSDHCWSLVSPFKMRRRPSLLLKDTAERCECLSIDCTECEHYDG